MFENPLRKKSAEQTPSIEEEAKKEQQRFGENIGEVEKKVGALIELGRNKEYAQRIREEIERKKELTQMSDLMKGLLGDPMILQSLGVGSYREKLASIETLFNTLKKKPEAPEEKRDLKKAA